MKKKVIIIVFTIVVFVIIGSMIYLTLNPKEKAREIMRENRMDVLQNKDNIANFNFETKTVKLNSGYEMPMNGIGTYSLTGDTILMGNNGYRI